MNAESEFTRERTEGAKTHITVGSHMSITANTSALLASVANFGGKWGAGSKGQVLRVTGVPASFPRGRGHLPGGEAGVSAKANTQAAVAQAKHIVGTQFMPVKPGRLLWRHL